MFKLVLKKAEGNAEMNKSKSVWGGQRAVLQRGAQMRDP